MRRGTLAGLVAAGAVVATVIGISVVWPGLDAQETPDVDTAVWALQTGDGRRYARVNTSVGELDTVRTISNPDQVVQTGDAAYLFSDSYSTITRIDAAMPADLDEEALQSSQKTPPGTTDVVTAGDYVAYLTDSGAVFAGYLSSGSASQLDPFASDDEDAPQYTADALAIDERGMLFAYSRADGAVLRYDVRAGEVRGRDPLDAEGLAAPAITAAGDTWAVVDTEEGDVWLRGQDASTQAPTTGAVVVGAPDPRGSAVYLADDTGLVEVPVDGTEPQVVQGGNGAVLGTPAQPITHDGETYAAWIGQGDAGGLLWSSDGQTVVLDYGDETMPDQRRPSFVASGSAVILNETRSGWAWSVPDGTLIPSSQDWSLDDRTDPDAVPSEEQLQVVLDPKPPVAEPDAFGVRAGALASLPVLMNDHDPNEDVLTIDPASVTGLDPGFGTVSVTDDGQRFALRVDPAATGSATFSYAVTDGTAEGGLLSDPTTVTVTVADAAVDSAPEWCGVERCLVEWPQPEVARGGTVTVPVLPGWVDPEGDPLLLLAVENTTGSGSVAATPAGDVVYQHSDTGDGGEQLVDLAVTIADTQGNTTVKSLVVKVSPQPQLTAQSFALTDTVASGITVDVADHVTGTAGTLSLSSARVLDDAAATATIVGGSTSFDFSAPAAGTYRVDFTVTDGVSEANGTARITLLPADAPAQLATSPVVAFVHPQQDATLDVFDAVSNPTRRVLLLSDVSARADAGATLSVDAVGQNHLRVSGTTADGAPGRLGTVSYVVSDGTEDAGSSVIGEATVYLLPQAPELAPIAVDDAVVVRAGAQIDIPVLDNDISPAGGRPTLNPATVRSTAEGALAFASGDLLRYLAPDEPGEYGIEYSVFTTGAPALVDTATVRVRVIDDDANRAPTADTLEGRVLSGQSALLPFDGFGMDPDGDVVTLDRIVSQPERGAATISADGTSILYTSVPGDSGQASFRYRVVDAFGETAEGSVRVGVLDSEANPSPVTFTDYVQVQVGEANTIRVSPLSNDVDPTMGELKVTGVRPDMPAALVDGSDNPEYARLAEQIADVDDTTVVISAGDEPGTMSFLYDVESSSGNTGRGLVVVRVVRESVPDFPVVDDTILTVETRDDFTRGVDVLDGKVAWSGGDVSDLELSLWGEPEGVSVKGSRLSGELPATTRLIPFAVTGEGAAGEVTSYGFLRVPGDDDLALTLRAGAASPDVTELESTTFDMASLVARPRGSSIEVGDEVRASGARAEAACTVESATVLRYDAGAGAPWVDACQVPVRLAGKDDWTYLSVPIVVNPRDPQPELRPGSITVGPGETATFDLKNMTTWQLREDWEGIQYALQHSGAAFEVSQAGSVVTVTGADRAVPGSEEAVLVSVTSHPAVTPARLILRVGAAPSTLPQGGSVVQQCSQASGSSCTIPVIGANGEVNPLPGTPLELVDVRQTGACAGVGFQVASSGSVTATWTADAPGATCTASFSVRDAQGRVTNSERDGRVLLDLLGYPKAPASLVQTAYADGSVTLRVDPGQSRQAYPALSGFVVRSGGQEVVRCTADGVCPPIPAPNGEPRTYEAWAVNSVGESKASVRTTGWAYDAPQAPASVTAAPAVTGDGNGGVVSLVIDGIETGETGSLQISSPAGETVTVPVHRNQTRVDVPWFRVGSNTGTLVTVTPYSRFELPPGLGGSATGAVATVQTNGVGSPQSPQLTLSSVSNGDGTSTITAAASASRNGDGSTLRFGVVQEGQRCVAEQAANGNTDTSFTTSFTVEDGNEYTYRLCVESYWGDRSYGRAESTASTRAQQSGRAPRDYTFVVGSQPRDGGSRAEWVITDTPTSPERPPRNNEVLFSNFPNNTIFDNDPGIQVWYRHQFWQQDSARATVTPAPGSAPYQVWANWSIGACAGGQTLPLGGNSSSIAGKKATITWSDAGVTFRARNGRALTYEGGWKVPQGTASIEGLSWRASWGAYGLSDATRTLSVANCSPNEPLPTGVVAGAPGYFTPDYARLPGNLSELRSIGAMGQTTAWTPGQYVALGDGSEAHWDGTAWTSGRAP
ncbi:Ig-like domain-containing protein [Microbacterium sp. M3]|uniref:Ig-like domain-containing protein n=1 Tax=Microbacterium arthrosphaerae TaxID=792652 RepID=A0ABU4H3L4_9MICO|nr:MULTISPECIES: Ig-like domain-containing protein [Microbacterium]MDW4573855.1 Ig-like domain-containing protein [Microbacterium arthrosphaerae]MDW7607710.1 Ig-like domain-containing protein [Microbacterium sp. M3]